MFKKADDLQEKLAKIEKIFDINRIFKIQANKNYIQKYYLWNRLAYSLFHSKKGFIHFAISRDGIYKESDLLEAVNFVAKYIKENKAKDVLELACGRGANSFYLADKFKDIKFYGIDLSRGQLNYARKRINKFRNVRINQGDFHNLENFEKNKFDIVFIIESLCHSPHKEIVLEEVNRVLKPEGIFIVIDGYWRNSDKKSDLERKTKKLGELSMAVNNFETYSNFIIQAKEKNFDIKYEEKVSKFLLPNARKFAKLASKFFNRPKLAKFLKTFLPEIFLLNSIAGYLSPNVIEQGFFKYYLTVLIKK